MLEKNALALRTSRDAASTIPRRPEGRGSVVQSVLDKTAKPMKSFSAIPPGEGANHKGMLDEYSAHRGIPLRRAAKSVGGWGGLRIVTNMIESARGPEPHF